MHIQIHGKQVYAYTGGKSFNPNLPSVIFVHGAQNDHSVWVLQSRYFAHHGYSVLAVDLPGHGRSQGPALHSIEELADWLLAFIDLCGAQQAYVVGHSMGSLIGLEAASKAPTRIQKLALLGTAFPMKVSDTLLFAAENDEDSAIGMVNQFSHRRSTPISRSPIPGASIMNSSKRLMERLSQAGSAALFHIDLYACNAYENGLKAAQAIQSPTLVIAANQDQMTPAKVGLALAQTIPQCQTVRLENCGHSMMTEQGSAVLDSLIDFLADASK